MDIKNDILGAAGLLNEGAISIKEDPRKTFKKAKGKIKEDDEIDSPARKSAIKASANTDCPACKATGDICPDCKKKAKKKELSKTLQKKLDMAASTKTDEIDDDYEDEDEDDYENEKKENKKSKKKEKELKESAYGKKILNLLLEDGETCPIKDKIFLMDVKTRFEDDAKQVVRRFLEDYRWIANGGRYEYQKDPSGISEQAVAKAKELAPQIIMQGIHKAISELKEVLNVIDEEPKKEEPETETKTIIQVAPDGPPVGHSYFNY
ncbi:MAG: hypothetical protein LBF97_02265 [Elusimicrobiota bacterium]|jgi:hypothetical protein|nr:hypothetical protein [Elusimicrobiota bacterium]